VLGGGDAESISLDELIYGPTPPPPLKPHRMAPDAVMRMAFTSGTTGNPKGVTHSFDTRRPPPPSRSWRREDVARGSVVSKDG